MKAKRMVVLILSLLLILSMVISCGVPAATPAATSAAATTAASSAPAETKLGGTITFWMQKYGNNPEAQQKLLDKIAADFKTKTGVEVKYSIVDWGQALTKYTLASTGGEAPDVAETFFAYSQVKMGGDQFGPMIIDDIAADVGTDGFYEFAKPECYINGHWYALPWRGDTRQVAYNEAHFKEAGITEFPKTFDELIEVGKKLTKTDANGEILRSGYTFNVGQARFDQTWFALLAGFGGMMMDTEYKGFTLNTDANREALQFMQDTVYKYNIMPKSCIDPSYDSTNTYAAEKTSIILGATPDLMSALKNNAPQVAEVTKSAVMPSKTGSGNSSIAFAAPVCVYKTSKNPDAAKAFLKYFISKDVQLEAMKTLSLVNVWKGVMEDPYFSDTPWFATLLQQNTRAQPGDMPLPNWSQIDAFPDGPMNRMCTKTMANNPVQANIDEAIAAIDKIQAESK